MDNNRNTVIRIFVKEFLNSNSQYNSLIGKKLKETIIPLDDIVEIISDNKDLIANKTKTFKNVFGKVNYIFKMIDTYYDNNIKL